MKLSKNKSGTLSIDHLAIINADDFGISKGTNKGILTAYKKGILTSASIMPSGPEFDDAVKISQNNPGLGVGIHLSLTWGKSCLTHHEIPDLVDSNNYFYPGISKVLIKVVLKKSVRNQIKKEFEAQIKKVISSKIKPDHLNGQEHVHFLPYIFPIVTNLSKKYNIAYVRIPLEPLFLRPSIINLIKWLFLQLMGYVLKLQKKMINVKVVFYGVLFTSSMNRKVIKKIFNSNKYAAVEVLIHPGYQNLGKNSFSYKKQKVDEFLLSKNRMNELIAATDRDLIKYIKDNNIITTTFGGNR